MWIRKEDYQGLRLEVQTLRDLAKLEQIETDLLPRLHQERLEYWKKRAEEELKPHDHGVVLQTKEGQGFLEKFNDLQKARDRHAQIVFELNEGHFITFGEDKMTFSPDVIRVILQVKEGHPSPYTPAEIEAWAKEKVEEEMKGWKVVKDSSGSLSARLESWYDRQLEMMQEMYPSLSHEASLRGLHAD